MRPPGRVRSFRVVFAKKQFVEGGVDVGFVFAATTVAWAPSAYGPAEVAEPTFMDFERRAAVFDLQLAREAATTTSVDKYCQIGCASLPTKHGPLPSFSRNGLISLTFSGSENAAPFCSRRLLSSNALGVSSMRLPPASSILTLSTAFCSFWLP